VGAGDSRPDPVTGRGIRPVIPWTNRRQARIESFSFRFGLGGFSEPVEDIVSLYNTLDGIFQPSTYEGLSNVVIEAQACCTPVALSREADNDDLVRDGETGIAFSIKSKVQIARALERLIELCVDEKRRRQMTERARSEIEKRFALQRDISTLQETYFRLLQEQRGG